VRVFSLPFFLKTKCYQASGFTLIELVITMLLLIVVTTIAIPSYTSFYNTTQDKIASERLLQALQIARNEAMLRGVTVTLCKSRDHVSCSGNWEDGQIIFTTTAPQKENILTMVDGIKQKGVLHWQSSLHREYVAFFPSGTTRGEDGTFWFCRSHESKASWAVVVNQAGRARLAADVKRYAC